MLCQAAEPSGPGFCHVRFFTYLSAANQVKQNHQWHGKGKHKKSYDFNTATKLNRLLVKALLSTGQLMAGESYDLDFDHQFIETEKYDAKMTYIPHIVYPKPQCDVV